MCMRTSCALSGIEAPPLAEAHHKRKKRVFCRGVEAPLGAPQLVAFIFIGPPSFDSKPDLFPLKSTWSKCRSCLGFQIIIEVSKKSIRLCRAAHTAATIASSPLSPTCFLGSTLLGILLLFLF